MVEIVLLTYLVCPPDVHLVQHLTALFHITITQAGTHSLTYTLTKTHLSTCFTAFSEENDANISE